MKYLLPCKCGQSVEIEPSQAGQTVACSCGENLTVPTMMQVKALSLAPDKPEPVQKQTTGTTTGTSYKTALIFGILGYECMLLSFLLWWLNMHDKNLYDKIFVLFVVFRGMACAFLISAVAFALREKVKSPLAKDTAMRRAFFIFGVVLLFPSFFLVFHLQGTIPQPKDVLLIRDEFSFGSFQRLIYRSSIPIPFHERRILMMDDKTVDYYESIDNMMPMGLYHYFRTLEHPTFGQEFQENFEAVKDTYRIWVTVNIVLLILSLSSIVVSFFLPRQTVVITGWSGSEWQ
jgi:hypothetical protein